VAFGGVPEVVVVPENGIEYEVPLRGGQKTGWYYDQRENRALLGRWARGARVLDVFSYIGAWGLLAAHHGAADVVCLDRSESALQFAERSARRNGLSIRTMNVDAWEGLRDLRGQTFDIAILDPPALIKRRRDHAAGLQAYYRLNRLAAELLADDGLLISCSCSYHLAAEELFQVVDQAGRHVGRRAQVVAVGGQGIDHPVHPSMPETRYLKCLAVRLVRDLPLSGTPA
jgi:23S rRNA (cytosine1962-C5)-methyltransferase